MLSNNVANATTGGYKSDHEFYSLYVAPEAETSDPISTMPVIDKPWTDFSQGTLHPTGNATDLALSGPGFFSVNGPSGPLYTRNGNFHVSSSGQLVSSDGYPVRGVDGNSLTLQSTRPIEILSDGTVQQDGQVIGQLAVADFTSTAGLAKQGNNYFRVTDPAVKPMTPSGTAVEQGNLEDSNVGTAGAAVRLISVMRQFEMLQKAVLLGSEMDRQAIQQVAKVGS